MGVSRYCGPRASPNCRSNRRWRVSLKQASVGLRLDSPGQPHAENGGDQIDGRHGAKGEVPGFHPPMEAFFRVEFEGLAPSCVNSKLLMGKGNAPTTTFSGDRSVANSAVFSGG